MKKTLFLLIIIVFLIPTLANAQEKPLLSKSIKKAINTQGINEAKKFFDEEFKSNKDGYNIDMKGISKVAAEYTKAKNYAAAGAVMEIASPFMRIKLTSYMDKDKKERIKAGKERDEKRKKEIEEKKSREKEKLIASRGEARKDIQRFTGLYGDPAEKDKYRKIWVTVSCDGYLVSGAMWGDAAPWWMKSEGDKVFTCKDSFNNVKMEFVTDENGKAIKMIHNLEFMKSPLERVGPLPEDWEPCIKRGEM